MTSSILPDSDKILGNITTKKLKKYLVQYTWEGKWENVIVMYYNFRELHTYNSVKLNGTALHVAIDLNKEYVVKELLNAIFTHHVHNNDDGGDKKVMALKTGNHRGDTPLHIAATRDYARICRWIIGENNERIYLLNEENNDGETPLFQAAINWRKKSFTYLFHISREIVTLENLTRKDGDSILHAAIHGEYFDLAVIIVHYYAFLIGHCNNKGDTPLKVLATRPSAFKSTSFHSWYKRILYHCIIVEQLDAERTMESYLVKMKANQNSNKTKFPNNFPNNYTVLCDFVSIWLGATGTGGPNVNIDTGTDGTNANIDTGIESTDANIDNGKKNSKKMEQVNSKEDSDAEKYSVANYLIDAKCHFNVKNLFDVKNTSDDKRQPFKLEKHPFRFLPPNYETFQQFVKSPYVHILGLCGVGVNNMKIAKENHVWSSQLLKELMKTPYEAFTGIDDPDFDLDKYDTYLQKLKETPFLVAARNGIVEMVNEILIKIPSAIHNINSNKENALHMAVKYRQPVIVETLKKHSDEQVWNNMTLAVDKDDNTILHLAANVIHTDKPSKIPGSALQVMWDIKWFEYIQSLVPHHFYFVGNNLSGQTPEGRSNDNTSQTPEGRSNANTSQTPDEIFRSSHKEIIKDGSDWLKDTSESCSVVAALVAGVSFATASAVPGGTTDDGSPTLEGKPAFDIFAISSLVGLCFSVTALIMFLSILTSRKQATDFRRDLPLKLLLGLTSLFVAIASMFVSFCTGHFFLLNHKYKSVLFPLYGATSIPVTFYAIAQFPLYYDLVIAIITKVPVATVERDKL